MDLQPALIRTQIIFVIIIFVWLLEHRMSEEDAEIIQKWEDQVSKFAGREEKP